MFNIFKKKETKYLADFFNGEFTDIHSHLLPGIDDGAKDMNNSKELIDELRAIGIKQFITTPHIIKNLHDNNREIIESKRDELNLALGENFRAAAEYMLDSHFFESIKKEKLLTLKDQNILIEMSYVNPPLQLYDILFELRLEGYQLVFAHPERYPYYFSKNFTDYKKLMENGCKFQLNLNSVFGYYGKPVQKVAFDLLEQNMITFVGTDAHHHNHVRSLGRELPLNKKQLLALETAINNNKFFD
jgi:protein-tyrosine phosphatase